MYKLFLLVIFMFGYFGLNAQNADNRFLVTEKVNRILLEKSNCQSSTSVAKHVYHIQLYNGQNMNRAKSIKNKFTGLFNMPASVEWENPEFKVWVGAFENKLSADQALLKIRKEFPNAFIVNPKKR